MIKGYCQSNLDDFKTYTEWPERFVAVPRIGDYVQKTGSPFKLKVCSITHRIYNPSNEPYNEPYIIVELTKSY